MVVPKNLLRRILYGVISPIVVLVGWELLYQRRVIHGYAVTAPSLILKEVAALFTGSTGYGSIFIHLASSLGLVLVAVTCAGLVGTVLGMAMASSRTLSDVFSPLLYIMRPLPPIALLPLTIVLFGLGEFSRLILVFAAVCPTMIFAVLQAARATDPVFRQVGLAMGATQFQILLTVVLPNALPGILTGLRISSSLGFMTVVAAELLGSTSGLGYLLSIGARSFDTSLICATLLLIACAAFLLDFLLQWLRSKVVYWEESLDE